MPVQIVEVVSAVRAGYLQQHDPAAWVHIREFGEVIHAGVDDAPDVVGAILTGDLLPCKGSHLRHVA